MDGRITVENQDLLASLGLHEEETSFQGFDNTWRERVRKEQIPIPPTLEELQRIEKDRQKELRLEEYKKKSEHLLSVSDRKREQQKRMEKRKKEKQFQRRFFFLALFLWIYICISKLA